MPIITITTKPTKAIPTTPPVFISPPREEVEFPDPPSTFELELDEFFAGLIGEGGEAGAIEEDELLRGEGDTGLV